MFELEFMLAIYDLYFQAMALLATAWAVSVTVLGWTILIWIGLGGRADPGRDQGE